MKQYHIVWEIVGIKTSEEDVTFDEIVNVLVYCYNTSLSKVLPEVVNGMKKGETVSCTFPVSGDTITITALEDTFIPF